MRSSLRSALPASKDTGGMGFMSVSVRPVSIGHQGQAGTLRISRGTKGVRSWTI